MNRDDNTKHQLITDEMAQEAYEALTEKTTRNFDAYEEPQLLPEIPIPGELVFFLDEILAIADEHLNRDPGETLAEVVDLGIVAWCANLDPQVRMRLGLPNFELNLGSESEQLAQLREMAAKREEELLQTLEEERAAHSQKTQALEESQAVLKAQVNRLQEELDTRDQNDLETSDTAQAQQRARLYEEAMVGYTPMTSHTLSGPTNNGPAASNGVSAEQRRAKRRARRRRTKPTAE